MTTRATQAEAEAMLKACLSTPVIRDFYGIRLLEWQPGAVTLQLEHRPELGHAPGWFQGTVTTAIAEYAAAISGATSAPDRDPMTLQQNIHFTGSAHGTRLVARGRVVSGGWSVSTCASEIFVERDGELHPCASLMMTLAHRKRKPR